MYNHEFNVRYCAVKPFQLKSEAKNWIILEEKSLVGNKFPFRYRNPFWIEIQKGRIVGLYSLLIAPNLN